MARTKVTLTISYHTHVSRTQARSEELGNSLHRMYVPALIPLKAHLVCTPCDWSVVFPSRACSRSRCSCILHREGFAHAKRVEGGYGPVPFITGTEILSARVGTVVPRRVFVRARIKAAIRFFVSVRPCPEPLRDKKLQHRKSRSKQASCARCDFEARFSRQPKRPFSRL